MLKNVQITYVEDIGIQKKTFHTLIQKLKAEFDFKIESLQVNFISAELILDINKKYLQHNNTTDIITFNYGESNILFDAELYISIDDARANADRFSTEPAEEFLRLVIHGILHLLGFDDTDSEKKNIMKKKEDALVKKYSFLLD